MPEFELTRTRDDRRTYALGDLGTLRLEGMFSRSATAETSAGTWRLARRGIVTHTVDAVDTAGAVAGEFRSFGLRRGGSLQWAGRDLALRAASAWRERYALVDGDRELAILDGKGWGKRPVAVMVDDPDDVEAGLLLFAAFVVRGLAEDASSAAGGASAATIG